MTIHTIYSYWQRVLGLCLMAFALNACTNDYFVDELNFRIYVPQIERGEIDNFCIVIHDTTKQNQRLLERTFSAPFDKDEYTKQGILRFKVPKGEGYKISCFANYAPEALNVLETSHSESSMKKVEIKQGSNIYASQSQTNPLSYLSTTDVSMLGTPDSKIPKIIDLNDNTFYKGTVAFEFTARLPDIVTRIDIYYKGLSTKYTFKGKYQGTDKDVVRRTFDVRNLNLANVKLEDVVLPSRGAADFGMMGPLLPKPTQSLYDPQARQQQPSPRPPFEFEIHLFSGSQKVHEIIFTKKNYDDLPPQDRPTDGAGNPLPMLLLDRGQKLSLKVNEKFEVANIKLSKWGEVENDEDTPFE